MCVWEQVLLDFAEGLEKKLVLKAAMMAVLQSEGKGVVLCQLEAADVESGAAPAACFALMGRDKPALQRMLAQKERKDSNPEPALVGFNCCETVQCYVLWSQSNKVVVCGTWQDGKETVLKLMWLKIGLRSNG